MVECTQVVSDKDKEITPFEAVPYADQEAMKLIQDKLLSNDAFSFDPDFIKQLQSEKRAAYSSAEEVMKILKLHDLNSFQGRAISHSSSYKW